MCTCVIVHARVYTVCAQLYETFLCLHCQVYIKHLADKLVEEEEGEGGEVGGVQKRKLKVAKRGAEPWVFTRCFHGWVPTQDTTSSCT